MWMCSEVNCKDYLCLGDDTLGAVCTDWKERGRGWQASTTDSLIGTQLACLPKQTVSYSLQSALI